MTTGIIMALLMALGMLQNSTVTDIEGNKYKTVKIGQQEWMAENLSTSKFRNGEDIFKATNRQEWIKAGEEGRAAWCYIGFNDAHANRGKLYNWYAVVDPRGLAPKDWKVPAIDDWDKLANRPDGSKLKHTNGWRSAHVQNTGPNSASVPQIFVNGNGSNSTGFSATPTSHFFLWWF